VTRVSLCVRVAKNKYKPYKFQSSFYDMSQIHAVVNDGTVPVEPTADFLQAFVNASLNPDPEGSVADLLPPRQGTLDDFVPVGNPFFADVGYAGDCSRVHERPFELNVEETNDDIVIAPVFIGSSTHAFVPGVPVRECQSTSSTHSTPLPRFMVWGGTAFQKAHYDIASATFVADPEDPLSIPPDTLRMRSSPLYHDRYINDGLLMDIPRKPFPGQEPSLLDRIHESQNPLIQFTLPYMVLATEIGAGLKWLFRTALQQGMYVDTARFHEQLPHLFTRRAQLARRFTDGGRDTGWITDEQAEGFSHATLGEIGGAIKKISLSESGEFDIGKFNRFLLYATFERNLGDKSLERDPRASASYIVGKPNGDSFTITLPYIPVRRASS
jgi:hypothetical protein